MWLPVTVLVLQFAVAIATITLIRRNTPPYSQAQTPVEEVALPSETENAIKERDKDLVDKTRRSEELAEVIAKQERAKKEGENEIAKQQRISNKLDTDIAERQRQLKNLEQDLTLAKSELDNLRSELVSLKGELNKLNTAISYARRTLKKSKNEIAQFERKKEEVTGKIRVLNQTISQKQLVVRDLQRHIDLMKNANHGSRNRQTLGRDKSSPPSRRSQLSR
jgi:chromosome segregation ATPase